MKSKLSVCPPLALVGLLCMLFHSCSAEKTSRPVSEETLETEIPVLMERALIPGLSIAVIRDGDIIWDQAFGVKSTKTDESVTRETIFEAASLSKPVFAYAVMRMVERGEIELDKPLLEYVSDQYIEVNYLGRVLDDDRFGKVTARMVLSHQSGLPNWRQNDSLTFRFDPGERFGYSGEGFGLLQKVVENITGLSLNEFVGNEVFDPLGMKHSSFNWIEPYEETTSFPHNQFMEAGEKRRFAVGHAAANLHTTASDYARFLLAMLIPTGLQGSSVDSMLVQQLKVDPEEPSDLGWGLGFGLERVKEDHSFWHWGDNGDFKCFCIVDPGRKNGVVYFTNSTYGLAVRKQIVELCLGDNHPVVSSEFLAGYGDVDSPWMEFVHVLVKDGYEAAHERFLVLSEELPSEEVLPEYPMNEMGYAFLRNEQFETAISIFKLNVEIYPESWNVYDSLGEAYMKSGNMGSAIENYKKSLELNPDNENAGIMLKRMKDSTTPL